MPDILGKYAWLDPEWTQSRLEKKISYGQSVADIRKSYPISEPFELQLHKQYLRLFSYPCGKGIDGIKSISSYHAGSLTRYNLLTVHVTTTRFCFDENDKLIGMKTSRWIDDP
jgi:hypothetical protein